MGGDVLDRPTIIGSREYIWWIRTAFERERQARFDAELSEAVPPACFVRTVDGRVGIGATLADAFHDLVEQASE